MPRALDLTNQRFGKLIALKRAPSKSGKTYWTCQCDCGTIKDIQTSHLTNDETRSCGCLERQINKTHQIQDRRQRLKRALVEANGHKCAACGLVDHYIVYDFHHIDPTTKMFSISGSTKSQETIATEAEKCVMLCAICHRKVENGLLANNFKSLFNRNVFFQQLQIL